MKLKNIFLTGWAITTLAMTGCSNFDDLTVNPNQPTSVPPSLIFNNLAFSMSENPWGDPHKFAQYWCLNYEYYGNQNYNWTTTGLNFSLLNNVLKMEEEATKSGANTINPYSALGKFFRAYYYVQMTQRVGDLPLTEALKGGDVPTPKYDNQKAIYKQVFDWLESSNNEITQLISQGNRTLSGDLYFNGDLRKWQKTVNSYRLRVLISLSKRATTDADLNLATQFAAILGNATKYPIFADMNDNLQLVYNSVTNKYPTNPDNFGFNATRYNMAQTYIKGLTDLKDPRVFKVAEPAQAKLNAGMRPTDFGAYVGANSGESLADMSTKALAGEYSFINRSRYYSNYTAEPNIIIGYIEMCFNISEAIQRGWATGNAQDWYNKGITASMKSYGIPDADISTYLAQPEVAYKGNNTDGLNQILMQKYLAFFQNSGWEAFYNQRRTGVPTFLVGPGNTNSQRIPKRWQYPTSERANNKVNYDAAIQSQFGSNGDNINVDIWLVK